MSGQSGIIVGFFDQVFGTGALVVEPHDQRNPIFEIGDKNPIPIWTRLEELILLDLVGMLVVLVLGITQRYKSIRLVPAFGLILKLALLIGIGFRRSFPLRLL